MTRKKKTLKGVARANFYQMIIKCTANGFAMMIGMVRKDPSLESNISVDWIVGLSKIGLISGGYDESDRLHPYPGLSKTVSLRDTWDIESRSYAKELLWHSNYRESLRDD